MASAAREARRRAALFHEHPLWPADPFKVYAKYGGRWSCDSCGAGDSGSMMMLHCKRCNVDLCAGCFFFVHGAHDEHPGHRFRLTCTAGVVGAQQLECDLCGAEPSNGYAFVCRDCSSPDDEEDDDGAELPFVLCAQCLSSLDVPELHEHRVCVSDPNKVYPETKGEWHCDVCGGGGKRVSQMWHCKQCGTFDLCSNCALEGIGDDDDDD